MFDFQNMFHRFLYNNEIYAKNIISSQRNHNFIVIYLEIYLVDRKNIEYFWMNYMVQSYVTLAT